jgi:predicted lysophospholipase L1 biosynthesis ABC-type transport system permease subunit
VFRLVIGQGVRVTLAGIAVGLVVSGLAARLLAGLLYGVSPTEALTWASAVAIWLVVAPVACWLPAMRATRVEPLAALRHD